MSDVTAPTSGRRVPTPVVAALVAGVVLLVAGGAWWYLNSGDDATTLAVTDGDAPVPLSSGTDPGTEDAAAAVPAEDEEDLNVTPAFLPLEVVEIVLSRDPFQSVRPPKPESAESVGPVATDAEDGGEVELDDDGVPLAPAEPVPAPAGGSGEPVPAPAGGSGEDGRACRTDGDVVCDGVVVSVVETLEPSSAVVEVDASEYVAVVGEPFADRFRLLGVDGDCALIQYGDETFRQCVGAAARLK